MSYGAGKAWVFSGGKYVNLTIWQLVISLVYEWLSPRKRVPTVKHLATAIEEAQPGAPKNRKKRIRADASPTSQSLRGVFQFAPHRLESVTSHDRSTFQLCMYLQNDMSLLNIAWTNFLILANKNHVATYHRARIFCLHGSDSRCPKKRTILVRYHQNPGPARSVIFYEGPILWM